jgi:hypothetical protein
LQQQQERQRAWGPCAAQCASRSLPAWLLLLLLLLQALQEAQLLQQWQLQAQPLCSM